MAFETDEAETQLENLCEHWSQARVFIDSLSALDTAGYRSLTRNYRNLASHAIPPRFGWGEIGFVTRSVEPWQELVAQGDGTFRLEGNSDRKSVRYSFGGTPPLDLQETYRANLQEQDIAGRALEAYCSLLDEILLALPSV